MEKEMQRRIAHWVDLYHPGETRRFAIRIACPSLGQPELVLPRPGREKEREEWAWDYYQYELRCFEAYQDDTLPHIRMITGTEIWAEALGCQVYYPENDMPMAVPYVRTAKEAARVKLPRLEDTKLADVLDKAERMRQRAGGDVLLGLPDMQSPMDIVAQIWDKSELFIAMIEEPEAVKELAGKAKALLMAFCDEWRSRFGRPLIAHCPEYYMPEGFTFSVDEVGAVNRDMFVEFFLDDLNALSDRYGGIGIHCCANSEHQWENFAKVHNLRLLNIFQPDDVIDRAFTFFADKTAQWHIRHYNYADPPETYQPGSRIVVSDLAPDVETARRMADEYRARYQGG